MKAPQPRHILATLCALTSSLLLACSGSYHLAHDAEVTHYVDEGGAHEAWCEQHQSYHHDEDNFYDGAGEVEVIIEEDHHVRSPARSGYTACGDFFASHGAQNQCQPGQYCADDTFSSCAQGCLSDVNCAGNQVCAKDPGMQVGICQNLDYYGSR